MNHDLFSRAAERDPELSPLPERMRPRLLPDLVGQEQLLAPGRFLERAIAEDRVPSLVLWGPPGTGKTTLARVLANHTGAHFAAFSAVGGTVKEVRELIAAAAERRRGRQRTILFIDEIHRFNKAQQDALLPSVEAGVIILVGATTENPSFSVIPALLSRCKVLRLEPLPPPALVTLLERALTDAKRGLGGIPVTVAPDVLTFIAEAARGDARYALTALEIAVRHAASHGGVVDLPAAEEAVDAKALLYDKSGEEHYNVISAFIKSLRGSDPDAALYWMFRMLEAGEDPLFVLRRMVIFASEDVGNADPHALPLVVAADQAFQRLGMPEGRYVLAQACTYLAAAPKSNAMVDAISGPPADIRRLGPLPVPAKLRNAPTALMKEMGYGAGYRYPHAEGGFAANETYLPPELADRRYYRPRPSGIELRIAERLRQLRPERTAAPDDAPDPSPTATED